MNENRLTDYLDQMRQAATDACSFVEGLSKEDFLADRRTQQAVVMSLIVIGEAATKVMVDTLNFRTSTGKCRGEVCVGCAIASRTDISTSTLTWCGTRCKRLCRNCWSS